MSRTLKKQGNSWEPLAARARPKKLQDFVGHDAVIGTGTPLRKAIEKGEAGSLILWGPPGVGKTTLAYLIVLYMDAAVERVSAVAAGVKDLRAVIDRARAWQKAEKRTVLIVDEIHRFNKAQQDVLLPVVENGLITLIGATTENPFFEVVPALVSRAEIVRLKLHEDKDIRKIVRQALKSANGSKKKQIKIEGKAMEVLAKLAAGDARRALNILDRVMQANEDKITAQAIKASVQEAVVQYDKAGDIHYDTISAFIKSLRGSDPDAALFYLFRMLAAGEDPKFIVRRMFIFASEDIGNADPHSLMLVAATSQCLAWVGLPEAEFALAHAAIYLAAAPKSNSIYIAKEAAKEDVRKYGNAPPPGHITNAPVEGMKEFGSGVGYKYPHDYPGHLVNQKYRPDVVQGNIYYQPGDEGFEKEVKKRVERARKVLGFE